MIEALSAQPRIRLGTWPTPLEDCPRLSAAIGVHTLVKRDDVNGLGVGGNKLRKLEFLLARAMADGADTIVTFGAVQTNHGRQTAAACAKLGLACELVLTRAVPRPAEDDDAYGHSGNVLLDRFYGARVHLCDDEQQTVEVYQRVIERAGAEGRVVATFPVGGSDGVGVLGYAAAVAELYQQLDGPPERIVVPVGSAGTAAGVALGVGLSDRPALVYAACVSHTAQESLADITRLVGEGAAVLGVKPPALDFLRVDDRAVGPGYGVPTRQVWDALSLFAGTEGITLDPVYTGKAAAAFLDAAAEGEFSGTTVFLHTGGLPGLFAYAREATAALGR